MKKILGLDLGTTSIGWAVVNEAEKPDEKSSIIRLGVRVNPLTSDELGNFEQGKSITTNADRALKHGMRLNLKRYELRRDNLIEILKENHWITNDSLLSENGNRTTFETYRLRAKAATEEITLEQLARVLLMINKKRGYKSNRKAKSGDEDGQLIDGMNVARMMYEQHMTPGQYAYNLLLTGKKVLPDFYRSDLMEELNRIWDYQKEFYPQILTDDFKSQITDKSKTVVAKRFLAVYGFFTADNKGSERRTISYKWRCDALSKQLPTDQLSYVISDVIGNIHSSSGYLGGISDRSKLLFFRKQTVGQYLMSLIDSNPNESLKNKVFYRQDYLDEFETIWETQRVFHHQLTDELKSLMRDVVIFYQRPLKSKKGLISFCEFESKKIVVNIDGKKKEKMKGLRVSPKSSPLFQEFKIWSILNNLEVSEEKAGASRRLTQEEMDILFEELSIKSALTKTEALKLLFKKYRDYDLNYKIVEGNRTQAALFEAYRKIIEASGHGDFDFAKMSAKEIMSYVSEIFAGLNFSTGILTFNSELDDPDFEKQPLFKLWHLLYSYEGDNSKTGNEKLIAKIQSEFHFDREYAAILSQVTFEDDYGSLSAKAMRKILPFMKGGNVYSESCALAGYRHSARSLSSQELDNKELKEYLELLPHNSLRNPVVEKILNQMINVVNGVIDTYGKLDEVRIELARELKKSAKEREELTDSINEATARQQQIADLLKREFGLANPTRNDIIRYRLYQELKDNGYKTLYSNTYIPREELFSKLFDIEHIIPQARLFDDSFSNKTLESRQANIEKSNMTAFDYVSSKGKGEDVAFYLNRIESLYKGGQISKAKYEKLKMKEADIPDGFINRDIRDTQYISKKAREILESIVRTVVPTTGSVTDRLREDWQLVDVMKELNWDKYDRLGLTEITKDKDGRNIKVIKDWTKRNDHRHHAMDALTIAFTRVGYIQYLNYLNSRRDESHKMHSQIIAIEQKYLHREDGKMRFNPPMPLDEFREQAKRFLEMIFVSIKAKNKVVTENVNVIRRKGHDYKVIQKTPRGQLHNETIYGQRKYYTSKIEKVGSSFDKEKIQHVSRKDYREALLRRLEQFGYDATKAFTGKNSLEKFPLYLDELHTSKVPEKVKIVDYETIYTIRKPISPSLKIDKVVDTHIRLILEERLKEFKGNAAIAFSNLDENPIWLNEERGIAIKRVTITGVSNAIAIHDKRDKDGHLITDSNDERQPVDFVSTGNNHHVAIYCDAEGKYHDEVVSFYEAVERANQGLSIVNKTFNQDLGWTFLYSMKQNEYFVFPGTEKYTDGEGNEQERITFNPHEVDLMNPDNYPLISPHLFRLQKMSKSISGGNFTRDYYFRHHLETGVEDNKSLTGVSYKRLRSLDLMGQIIKVRVNHLGQIVKVGEY